VVPDTLDELLTPAWLTAALSPRYPGVHVTSVTPGPVVERLSTNARFEIECDPAPPPGLPTALCAKGYFAEHARSMGYAGVPEASFYRDLAGDTGVRTLHSVWADVHPETQHGVVITEDVIAGGGVFLDASSPCSVEQLAAVLGELARLHGHAWEDSRLADTAWLTPRIDATLRIRGVKEIRQNFEGAPGEDVPDDVKDPDRLVDAIRELSARGPGPGWTVIHGDTHVGNTFLDADGHPGLVDWQLVQRGLWCMDVAYAIASALEPGQRAAAERDLLRHYLDCLAAEGVSPPSFDAAWDEYRRVMPYGFFLWGITLFVSQDIITILLRRIGTAVHELESYQA
jgi:hypothetical protein